MGKYEDGSPGELFIVMSKEGSVVSGLLDSFATAVSLALQYGVPLKVLIDKFSHGRYEPSGFTTNPQIRMAKSITDYIFRWLALKFLPAGEGPGGRRGGRRRPPGHGIPESEAPGRPFRPARGHGCAALPGLRIHHDPGGILLPLRKLRRHQRVFVDRPVEVAVD